MEDLQDLEKQKKEKEEYVRILSILLEYKGEDRIITSQEAFELSKEERNKPSFNSGIPKLDTLTSGFREGQLIVISAPTGQGKTTLCQTLTKNFADREVGSLWFSFEVGISEFLSKFVWNGEENIPAFYLPRTLKQKNTEWLETRILEGIAKYNIKAVFVDHLHYLIEMDKMAQAKNLSLLVGMMMRDLKQLAIRHNIMIFLVSHMRKLSYESRKMPEVDDLRDSSFVGQESDIVIFLKRDKQGEEYQDTTRLRVAKNRRTGDLGGVKLQLIRGLFQEVTNYDDAPIYDEPI
jgi:replicative DNA helicase